MLPVVGLFALADFEVQPALLPGGVTYVRDSQSVRPLVVPLRPALHASCINCGAPPDGRWLCSYCLTTRDQT